MKPEKFKNIYISRVKKYLKEHTDEIIEKKVNRKDRNGKTYQQSNYIYTVNLPTIEGFAYYIGVSRKTLYNWQKKHPKFKKALNRIKAEQLERLINNGLSGNYNPTIAKLILSSNYGMKERVDSTTDDKPLPSQDPQKFTDAQINRIAQRVVERTRSASIKSS